MDISIDSPMPDCSVTVMPHRKPISSLQAAFTLIEMSISLVIIGLIVGGILVGQDLIRSAEVRATITQVERLNTATNTFRGKFGYLPGDINASAAATFGFVSRGTLPGQGDGNGEIEGWYSGGNTPIVAATGETAMFWVDLSSTTAGNLIEGGFTKGSPNIMPSADITTIPNTNGTTISSYLPQAKLGHNNYFYVYSGAYCCIWSNSGINYFGLSAATNIAASSANGTLSSTPNIPVAEAYAIDNKMDDGMPQSGNVMAWYLNAHQYWADGSTDATTTAGEPKPYSGALNGTATTCYDNGNNSAMPTAYSIKQNNGAGANCALSFKMQAGD